MTQTGRWLGVLFGIMIGTVATAQPPQPPMAPAFAPSAPMATMPAANGSMAVPPTRVVLSEVVEPGFREAVLSVVRKPTVSTRGTSADVVTTPAVYEWLLAHPDRVALAWRRLKVPCVGITDLGNGKFAWSDGDGSELVWQTVGRFPDGVIWYATGKVKPSAVIPTVSVRAVVVMTHPKRPGKDGAVSLSPSVQAFLHTDSKTANVVMRMLGPTAPKLAEQGAEQLLFFFSGIARYTYTHPEKAEALLAPGSP